MKGHGFLSSITLVALGAIGGFAIFHSGLQYNIEKTQQKHNVTLGIVSSNYKQAEKDRQKCVETDNGRLQEISDLRGRLDAQYKSWYDLTGAQRAILAKERESQQQMQRFQQVYERDQRELATLRTELQARDKNLVAIRETVVALQESLEAANQAKAKLESELSQVKKDNTEETKKLMGQIQVSERQIEADEQRIKNLVDQREKLETESRELRRTILKKDKELETAKKDSEALEDKKALLELSVAEIKAHVAEQDEELFRYREEEGELETKLINFREGMLELLRGKMKEIKDLETRVDLLNQEKADLEAKLENWREGMLELVKEKLEEIEELKSVLAESQESTDTTMKEIEMARSEQILAEEYVQKKLDIMESEGGSEDEEFMKELMAEIEHVRAQLKESQDWVVEMTKDIEDRKAYELESEGYITEKTNEIRNLKLKIEKDHESTTERISKLESELAEAKKLVVEKTNEIERLNSELGEFVMEVNNLKPAVVPGITTSEMMIKHVQQRDGMICRQLFGKGPYYVKFVIKLPSDESDTEQNSTVFFVVELSSRRLLPHSTYTFLTLVESNLYNDGVAFLSAREGGGLRISSSQSPGTSSLEHKLKPLGLTDGSSLSFLEAPTSGKSHTCGENSFGFVHRGPGLDIFLSSDDDKSGCFAQVIRGQDNLQKIQSILVDGGEPMEIVSAKHLRVD